MASEDAVFVPCPPCGFVNGVTSNEMWVLAADGFPLRCLKCGHVVAVVKK